MSNQDHAYALPSGFMLEEYQIERVLGVGGFGITYFWKRRGCWPGLTIRISTKCTGS